jgi:hypothetical protein
VKNSAGRGMRTEGHRENPSSEAFDDKQKVGASLPQEALDPERGRHILECRTFDEFDSFVSAREGLPEIRKLMIHRLSSDEYRSKGARLFMTVDGKGGFGLIGSELVSLFSYPDAHYGASLMDRAIAEGARCLSCFDVDDHLPRFYRCFGFREVARQSFNPQMAPSSWMYESLGQPDVVWMSLV